MRISSGSRPGRSHRDRDIPCQDAYAVRHEPGGLRAAAAVADGLGSRPLSHLGSQAAAKAATDSLFAAKEWGPKAVHRAFRAARTALSRLATEQGASADDYATTLQVVGVEPGHLVAGIVGDGAVLTSNHVPHVLLAPQDSEYADQTVPITARQWSDHLRYAETRDATAAFLMTDGLTRLLMARRAGAWHPFAPFFDSVLPRLQATRFDEGLAARFLDADHVDRAWDDDKCLVVIGLDQPADG